MEATHMEATHAEAAARPSKSIEAWERTMLEDQVRTYAGRVAPKNAVRDLMDRINGINAASGTGKNRSLSSINSALCTIRKDLFGNGDGPGMGVVQTKLFDDPKRKKSVRRLKTNPVANMIYDAIDKIVAENNELKAEIRKLRMIRDAVESYQKRLHK